MKSYGRSFILLFQLLIASAIFAGEPYRFQFTPDHLGREGKYTPEQRAEFENAQQKLNMIIPQALSSDDIRNLHNSVAVDVAPEFRGTFRSEIPAGSKGRNVMAGAPALDPRQAADFEASHPKLKYQTSGNQNFFVYPPGQSVDQLLDGVIDDIKKGPQGAPIDKWAQQMASDFVMVHPFPDGNGRTTRSIYRYILAQQYNWSNEPDWAAQTVRDMKPFSGDPLDPVACAQNPSRSPAGANSFRNAANNIGRSFGPAAGRVVSTTFLSNPDFVSGGVGGLLYDAGLPGEVAAGGGIAAGGAALAYGVYLESGAAAAGITATEWVGGAGVALAPAAPVAAAGLAAVGGLAVAGTAIGNFNKPYQGYWHGVGCNFSLNFMSGC